MEMYELSYEELEQVVGGGWVIDGPCDPDAVTELYFKTAPPEVLRVR